MKTVTLYTKPGCHLCENALEVIERVGEEVEFELQSCNIEKDERAHRAYFERIPVVVVDGEELCEFHVEEAQLRRALQEHTSDAVEPVGSDHPLESPGWRTRT